MKRTKAVLIFLLLMPLLFSAMAAGAAPSAADDKRIIKIGSDVTIEPKTKVHSVVTIGGQITVAGTVEGSVAAIGGSVVLTKTAIVGGSVTALGGVIVMARDAQVDGDLTEINSSNLFNTLTAALSAEWEGWSWIFAIVSLAIFLMILVLALLIVALLPKPIAIVTEAITEHTFKVVLSGLLGLVLIAPLALLLTISVVGIVLIPLEIIIVVCSILMGFIAVGQLIGSRLLRWVGRPTQAAVRATFWGLILLWLIGWIPYIGWMVKVVALVIGLGATLVTRFGTHRGWACVPTLIVGPATAAAASPEPPPAPGTPDAPAGSPAPPVTPEEPHTPMGVPAAAPETPTAQAVPAAATETPMASIPPVAPVPPAGSEPPVAPPSPER